MDKKVLSLPTRGRVLVKAASVYDAVQPVVTLGQESRLNRWVANKVKLSKDQSVLDVGCGTGLLTYEISKANPESEIFGIDASEPMIDVARRKRSNEKCNYRQALGENLPFEDESFDVVTSALFFHHVDYELKQKCLSEAFRVLKKGGKLLIADMGKPYTFMGVLLSYGAWIFFRQPEIKENIDGVLDRLIPEAGFDNFEKIARFSGYITVISARKKC